MLWFVFIMTMQGSVMYLYPKINKDCYYAVETKEDKELLISIANTYGVNIDKIGSRVPFYFTVVQKVSQQKDKASFVPYIQTFKNDPYYFDYCFEASIHHFEENLVVEYFGDIANKRVNYIYQSPVGMSERYISKVYQTHDGRKFEISNQSYHYSVNVRDNGHFRLGSMYKLQEMISVKDHMPEPNKMVILYSEKSGEYRIENFQFLLSGKEEITHWCNLEKSLHNKELDSSMELR